MATIINIGIVLISIYFIIGILITLWAISTVNNKKNINIIELFAFITVWPLVVFLMLVLRR